MILAIMAKRAGERREVEGGEAFIPENETLTQTDVSRGRDKRDANIAN